MPGELATKLRLVRCPKCRLLLPELPHFDVYKCGGCGATLQAKRRKSQEVNSESSSHESEKTPRNSSDLVEDTSCKKEQLVFSLENVERTTTAVAASSGELSLDDNCRKSQNQNGPRENDLGTKASECHSVESAGRDQNERGECNGEQLEISNLSDEDLEYEMDASEHSGIKIDRHEVSNDCCSTGLTTCEIKANDANLQLVGPEELNNESLFLKGTEEEFYSSTREQNPKSDFPGGAKSTAKTTESSSTSKSTANVASEKASISHISACIGKGHATSDNHVISSTELLKQSQSSINISFERGRSADISDATEVINLGSDFSGTLGELSNSPTTRSSHAYDGSVSSYDGVDELIPGYQHSHPLDNTNSVVDDVSVERPRMARILVDSMTYGDSRAHQRLNFSSDFPSENHHVMEAVDRKEFQSKMPFHYSGSQSVYESGSPLNQLLDEMYCSSIFLPSDTCEDPDQEKMKLLRMIYMLQDQLSRSSSVNGETNGRLSSSTYKGKRTLPYLSHDLQEERFHQALDYLKCDGRFNHGINRGQRHKLSLNPGSAEATSSTNHVPLSCLHSFLQEWQCPAELPSYVCQHEEPCRYHHGHNYCSPHYSYPLIPRWTMNSKTSLYSCETKSDYQMHRAYEAKKYPREKQNLANRHVCPVAGGAPFVICHHCFRLLQLPADFLLKLKCGSCSEVLKFSLTKSYEPGKLNDQSKVVNGSNRPPEPDANRYNSSPAVPSPYSDKDSYGLSASKSYSSEDPFSLSAFRSPHGWGYDQSVSRGMSEAIIEKEKIASSHSISNPIDKSRSAGLVSNVLMSKKVSSQMDARAPPPPRSSPLHQLMGYTSLSQVIRGTKSSSKCNIMVNGAKY